MSSVFWLQDSSHPETLINLIVLTQHLGKAPEVRLCTLNSHQFGLPYHPPHICYKIKKQKQNKSIYDSAGVTACSSQLFYEYFLSNSIRCSAKQWLDCFCLLLCVCHNLLFCFSTVHDFNIGLRVHKIKKLNYVLTFDHWLKASIKMFDCYCEVKSGYNRLVMVTWHYVNVYSKQTFIVNKPQMMH